MKVPGPQNPGPAPQGTGDPPVTAEDRCSGVRRASNRPMTAAVVSGTEAVYACGENPFLLLFESVKIRYGRPYDGHHSSKI